MEGCEGGNKKFKDDGKVRRGRGTAFIFISPYFLAHRGRSRSIKYICIYIYTFVEGNDPRSDFYSRSNRESGDPGKIRATNPNLSSPPLPL